MALRKKHIYDYENSKYALQCSIHAATTDSFWLNHSQQHTGFNMLSRTPPDRGGSGGGGVRKRLSKQEVCDSFLARLQERGDIDLSVPAFVEGICQHFERLPTRYALDVNTDSLDVLSHKRLLDEARLDPTTVSFAVRSVEVLHARPRDSSDGLPSPAFIEVQLNSNSADAVHCLGGPLKCSPVYDSNCRPHPDGESCSHHAGSLCPSQLLGHHPICRSVPPMHKGSNCT